MGLRYEVPIQGRLLNNRPCQCALDDAFGLAQPPFEAPHVFPIRPLPRLIKPSRPLFKPFPPVSRSTASRCAAEEFEHRRGHGGHTRFKRRLQHGKELT